jgi:hypothetical protein
MNQMNKTNQTNECNQLAIERFASIAKEVVVGCQRFVPRIGRIDFDGIEFFLISRRAM